MDERRRGGTIQRRGPERRSVLLHGSLGRNTLGSINMPPRRRSSHSDSGPALNLTNNRDLGMSGLGLRTRLTLRSKGKANSAESRVEYKSAHQGPGRGKSSAHSSRNVLWSPYPKASGPGAGGSMPSFGAMCREIFR